MFLCEVVLFWLNFDSDIVLRVNVLKIVVIDCLYEIMIGQMSTILQKKKKKRHVATTDDTSTSTKWMKCIIWHSFTFGLMYLVMKVVTIVAVLFEHNLGGQFIRL